MRRMAIAIMMILAVALSAQADTLTWNITTTTGDYGTAGNWNPAQTPTSADLCLIDNGGTATISSGDHNADDFYLGKADGKFGDLSMSGGSLTAADDFASANGKSSGSTVNLSGSSVISAADLNLGVKGTNVTDVGSSAALNADRLRVGMYGPDKASTMHGKSTLNLAGTATAGKIYVSSNGAIGEFNLNGGTVACSGDFDMDDNAAYPNRSATLTVNGSTGSFSANNLYCADEDVALNFVADTNGFTTLNIANAITIDTSTLNINLDAYTGSTNTPLVLMSGASVAGAFSAVNWLGSESAYVKYGATTITVTWDDPIDDLRQSTSMDWVGATGLFSYSNNWDKVYVPISGDTLNIDNGGTATIATDSHAAGHIILGTGTGESGHLSMTGGSLTNDVDFTLANGISSTGTVTLTGSSSLICGINLNIGMRNLGILDIGSSASVSAPSVRVGGFGPDVSSTLHGDGTLNLAGSLECSDLYMPSASGIGQFNLNGGNLVCENFYMDWNATGRPNHYSSLTVNGSAGSFSVMDGFSTATTNATLNFVVDAGGVTTLNVSSNVNISGATLNVDVSASPDATHILIHGASLSGTFGSVNITGGAARLVYDTVNGDVLIVPDKIEITSMDVGMNNGSSVVTVAFDYEDSSSLWFTSDLVSPDWTNVVSGAGPLSYTNSAPIGFYKVTSP